MTIHFNEGGGAVVNLFSSEASRVYVIEHLSGFAFSNSSCTSLERAQACGHLSLDYRTFHLLTTINAIPVKLCFK